LAVFGIRQGAAQAYLDEAPSFPVSGSFMDLSLFRKREPDRHGKWRIEYRRAGKTIALRGAPGTSEFQASYDAARAIFEGEASGQPATRKVLTGTLRWLCVEYYKSAEFHQLTPNTQRARRLVIEGILRETDQPKLVAAIC
jgi:hypothetical protein